MITKNEIKLVKSLQIKKYRKEQQCFVVEGTKSVQELISSSFEIETIYASAKFLATHKTLLSSYTENLKIVDESILSTLGSYENNTNVLAVARMSTPQISQLTLDNVVLLLDDIRDPGNLGTIIRTADWFGINHIICSKETAEFYNPKVIQATMGSFARVKAYYEELVEVIKNHPQVPIYGAYLDGDNIKNINITKPAFLAIGNEANGISPEIGNHISQRISIQGFGKAESLNAGVAAGIMMFALCS